MILTIPEPGTMEYNNHTVYLTTYLIRRSIPLNQDKVIIPHLYGVYSCANGPTFTLRLKYGADVVSSVTPVYGDAAAQPWEGRLLSTIRTSGTHAQGTSQGSVMAANLSNSDSGSTSDTTINTTVINTFSVTIQWSAAAAGN